ncbi:MarR family winged helix-turn-helix transcriptional regulator [Dulcicalothrix desertica]|uniref:MarR family winged helix-turn-helix transcriptional regulator n=2 Tax=Dulcicalothrix desertica TaxID=32056 RepID=UPI00119C0E5E|nr:MarR family transcriptional regulator [Dulcicalothrix desertica]TWH54883.1 DNA-binding MarR family transcriptional regulator [Dulcicalothrix desertica PCC 7102]
MNQFISNSKIINVYRASAVLESVLDAALAPIGITTAQWGSLRIIYENPGCSGADISRIAFVSPQAATTMLQRLEQAKLITRRPPKRGRVLETYLTERGEELLREGDNIVDETEARFFSNFTPSELHDFNEYLLRSIANLDFNK